MTYLRRAVSVAMIAAVFISSPWLAAQDQRPVFRGTAEGVRVDVSVQQRTRPVTGLKAADFELLDNNVPQEILDVIYEVMPIDVTVALDVSFSVDGPQLEQLRQSVRDLRADLRPQDRLKLLSFNMRVMRQTQFTNERSVIERALAGLKGSGSTSVFDTIAVSLVATASPERRHLVMVFTDANDTNSITPPFALNEVALRSSAALGFVVVTPPSRMRLDVPVFFRTLARDSGGQALTFKPGENLSSSFKRLLDDFRASYVLLFRPTGVDREGMHRLEVSVKREGSYDIRARRGYFR